MPINTIIVDDEKPARDELAYLLKGFPEINVIGQGKNGVEAVALIKEHSPDLVFLDVQMPGLDGFGVLKKLVERKMKVPHVVFATAFDHYAVKAFDVAPLIITVQTVPAVPGITVALDDGRRLLTDISGQVVLAVARAGVHSMSVSLPAPTWNTRISFMRWSDDSWTPSRPIRVVRDVSISLGLRLAYLTPIQFVDLDLNPLDPSRVNGVIISGPNAEVIQPQYPYDSLWLQTPLPAKHSGESGLHITAAPYSLSFAKYDKLNVASVGQMRFTPELNGTWKIRLLLYTLRLGAKDALFGTTLDNPIRLTGPTGRSQTVMLDRQGHSTLVLGRGNYAAQVLAPGLTPIATMSPDHGFVAVGRICVGSESCWTNGSSAPAATRAKRNAPPSTAGGSAAAATVRRSRSRNPTTAP